MDDEALTQARGALRQLQGDSSGPGTLPATLEMLGHYLAFEPTDDPYIVRRGGLKFDPQLETSRIDLAEGTVNRIDPGPLEQPAHLSMLTYAAASLQMALPPELLENPERVWARTLLGTVYSHEVQSGYGVLDENEISIIYVSSALIDLLMGAAEITGAALAARPVPGTTAREELDPEGFAERLDRNPEIISRLYALLKAHLYDGRAKGTAEDDAARLFLPPAILFNQAIRWVIGHEFGHHFAAEFAQAFARTGIAEESFADFLATYHTAFSTVRLDRLPPELGVAGGTFFLACHDVLQRALSVARSGVETPDAGDAVHPASEARATTMVDVFEAMVEFSSDQNGITIALRDSPKRIDPDDPDTRLYRSRTLGHARMLFAIWARVKPLLLGDFQAGRKLHPNWA